MARSRPDDAVFVKLGLDFTQFEIDMNAADKTVADAFKKLNAESRAVKLKMQIDEATFKYGDDVLGRINAKEKNLNDTLRIQSERLRITEATYKQLSNDRNANEKDIDRWHERLLREQKDYANIEAELRRLSKEQADYLKGKQRPAFSERAANVVSGRSSIGSEAMDALAASSFASSVGGAASLLKGGFSLAGIGIASYQLNSLMQFAMQDNVAIYQLSQRLNTTTQDAETFKDMLEFVGASAEELAPIFAKLDKQLLNSGSGGGLLTESMRKFNFALKDSEGNLLPMNEQLDQLAKGYANAAEQGQQEVFIATVLGSRGQALVPLLQREAEIRERIGNLTKAEGPTAKESMLVAAELKQTTMQFDEIKKSAGNALIPIARDLLPTVNMALQNATMLVNNFSAAWKLVTFDNQGLKLISEVFKGQQELGKAVYDPWAKNQEINGTKDLLNRGVSEYAANKITQDHAILTTLYHFLSGQTGEKYGLPGSSTMKDWLYNNMMKPLVDSNEEEVNANKESYLNSEEHRKNMLAVQEEEYKRTHNLLENEIYDIRAKTEESIRNGANEADAWELASEKIATAIQKVDDTVNKSLRNQIYGLSHSDLMTALHNVQSQAEDLAKQGADPWLVSQASDLQEAKIRKDFMNNVSFPMAQPFHTDLENAIAGIEKQKAAYIQAGAEETQATEWAERQRQKTIEQFEDSTMSQIKSIWQDSLTNKLDAIDREKEAFRQKGVDEVNITQWAERQKQMTMQQSALAMVQGQRDLMQVLKNAYAGQVSGFFGEGVKAYDFTSSPQQRMNLAALAYYRHKYGITAEDEMTPEQFRAYSAASDFGQRNVIPGMEVDAGARNAPISYAPQTTVNINQPFVESEENMKKLADTVGGVMKPAYISALNRLLGGEGYA